MFRSDKPTNYEEVYQGLIGKLARADYRHALLHLGARDAGARVAVDVFNRTCLVGPDGVEAADGGRLDFTIRICLAYYILQGGRGEPSGAWAAYRDFKDGAFFHAAFAQIVEGKIAADFAGRPVELARAAASLAGKPFAAGLGGDFCFRFPALPRMPLILIFYDADDEFPASARVLFDQSAPNFLDMECLAVLGLILADQLARAGRTG
ncbi:MAG: DUF3786 domain-containing protein [Thermodesulfobacteriota bacterium]